MRNYSNMNSGVSDLVQAFMGASGTEQQAYQKSLSDVFRNQSNQASARKNNAAASLDERRLNDMDTGNQNFMQGATGLQQPQLNELSEIMLNGFNEKRTEGPPTADGVAPVEYDKPHWLTSSVQDKYNRAQMTMGANQAGTGKTNAEQMINALQGAANINRQDNIISGEADPSAIGKAMAATAGKSLTDVTGSGIAYDKFAPASQELNTQAFDRSNTAKNTASVESAKVRAQGTVDAALARVKANGNKLPAEAKLINFYMNDMGYPQAKAIEMAKARKNKSMREVAADIYLDELEWQQLNATEDMSDEAIEQKAQERTLSAIGFLNSNNDSFDGGDDKGDKGGNASDEPPVAGAKQAPDGNWYVNKNGQWFKVEQ